MVQAILEKFETDLKLAPVAAFHHHAYIGGLLEHTASVLSIAVSISNATETCNKDMMIAGAVLHDLGKFSELDYTTIDFKYTLEGSLLGHATLGNNYALLFT
ncbi:HD domain-containing protein [Peptococcaceae bacterium 1198_IL3148]